MYPEIHQLPFFFFRQTDIKLCKLPSFANLYLPHPLSLSHLYCSLSLTYTHTHNTYIFLPLSHTPLTFYPPLHPLSHILSFLILSYHLSHFHSSLSILPTLLSNFSLPLSLSLTHTHTILWFEGLFWRQSLRVKFVTPITCGRLNQNPQI